MIVIASNFTLFRLPNATYCLKGDSHRTQHERWFISDGWLEKFVVRHLRNVDNEKPLRGKFSFALSIDRPSTLETEKLHGKLSKASAKKLRQQTFLIWIGNVLLITKLFFPFLRDTSNQKLISVNKDKNSRERRIRILSNQYFRFFLSNNCSPPSFYHSCFQLALSEIKTKKENLEVNKSWLRTRSDESKD